MGVGSHGLVPQLPVLAALQMPGENEDGENWGWELGGGNCAHVLHFNTVPERLPIG